MFEIKKISDSDTDYPAALKKIKDRPKDLYYIGNIKNISPSVGIVGTRRCSNYGRQVASEFSKNLAARNITIVSGFAPGIDTVSHIAAIETSNRTIVVLGTGLSEKCIYPKENIPLIKKIIELGGCLISEYPPNTFGSRFTFPQRNRIVAAISDVLLVVEAPQKSGALITANYAFSYGKKVFSIPGSIYYENALGTNNLLKRGAHIATKADDILQTFPLCDTNYSQISVFPKTTDDKSDNLTPEMLIMKFIKNEPRHIDKIIEELKMPAGRVASIITILEIEEKIKNIGENIYSCLPRE
jgi:DNA processing protein